MRRLLEFNCQGLETHTVCIYLDSEILATLQMFCKKKIIALLKNKSDFNRKLLKSQVELCIFKNGP